MECIRLYVSNSSAAVVFDWDGTICDNEFLIDEAIKRVMDRVDPAESLRLSPLFYNPQRHISPLKALRLPEERRESLIREIKHELDILEEGACTFEGSTDLFLELKRCGIPLGILTRRRRTSLDEQLRRYSLETIFDVAICREDVPAKPHPDGLFMIMKKLSVDKVIMVGNSVDDFLCARNAGAHFIGVHLCKRSNSSPFFGTDCDVMTTVKEVHLRIMKYLEFQ